MDKLKAAQIIVDDWLNADRENVILIITDESHEDEARLLCEAAIRRGAVCKVSVLEGDGIQHGESLEKLKEVMSYADVIVGATDYSFITTGAVKYALEHGGKFLSLPLSTNNGDSLLQSEFIAMSPAKAAKLAGPMLKRLNRRKAIRAVTAAGTDVSFSKSGRRAGLFNGVCSKRQKINSSSFEIYVPIVENSAAGTVIVDGSLGYIGVPGRPFAIELKDGAISYIEDCPDGRRLRDFIESFRDERMFTAGEFGIGLNQLSQCRGRSYIEDESAYGTFHIGFGRNLALGGSFDAPGHFDLVMRSPDIYAENSRIMEKGSVITQFKLLKL